MIAVYYLAAGSSVHNPHAQTILFRERVELSRVEGGRARPGQASGPQALSAALLFTGSVCVLYSKGGGGWLVLKVETCVTSRAVRRQLMDQTV